MARAHDRPIEDDWLWGWDPTPGIVSVWALAEDRIAIWRRIGAARDQIVVEEARFRPWLVSARSLAGSGSVTERVLAGDAHLRYLVRADDNRALLGAVRRVYGPGHVRDFGEDLLVLPPEEQYLVATGRTYFRDLAFADLRRAQIDLETTGLDPTRDRIFLIALRAPDGTTETIEGDERSILERLVARITALDPDVIENHNLHGFDLPFLVARAKHHRVELTLGRGGSSGHGGSIIPRPSRRGHVRYTAPGRELIDTMDATLRYDFAVRELPNHGLKAVARHLGIASDDREIIRGDRIASVYASDPDRVRRYAVADVTEVEGISRVLGGAAFALATMVPRRYERLADAGGATGVLDPLLVRAYLRSGTSLPAHEPGDGTPHAGAALHLFAAGHARRVVKADVASLYPSLMREYRIGPARDRLGVLLALVDRLVARRLEAKQAAKRAAPGSAERHTNEAMSAAMKLVVNTAYGYLAAGGLTRFADVHAANDITRRGRELLDRLCREIAARGGTLIEADTDGVYFAVDADAGEADERRIVAEVAALLPAMITLEFEGRYAAMLSHEPKNYALLGYDGKLALRGVAFRSSRAEPFGEDFLRRALRALLVGDVPRVRAEYLATIDALRRRELPTRDVTSRVRLSKPPGEVATRRELPYEAMAAAGRTTWTVGDRIRVYRGRTGPRLFDEDHDPRDYDVDHYLRVLHHTFASRLVTAFAPEDFAAVFADPDQLALFAPPLHGIRTLLTRTAGPGVVVGELAVGRHDGLAAGAVGQPVGDEPAVEPVDEIDAGDAGPDA